LVFSHAEDYSFVYSCRVLS